MSEELKQIIKDALLKLPIEKQKALSCVDWAEVTKEIGNRYLQTEEIEALQKEIAIILLGLEYPTFITRNLINNLPITQDIANEITKEVIEKIFTPIAEKIEESIKNKISKEGTRWKQNINFIISGGDYSVFIK